MRQFRGLDEHSSHRARRRFERLPAKSSSSPATTRFHAVQQSTSTLSRASRSPCSSRDSAGWLIPACARSAVPSRSRSIAEADPASRAVLVMESSGCEDTPARPCPVAITTSRRATPYAAHRFMSLRSWTAQLAPRSCRSISARARRSAATCAATFSGSTTCPAYAPVDVRTPDHPLSGSSFDQGQRAIPARSAATSFVTTPMIVRARAPRPR